MVRSPPFRVYCLQLFALFGLAFALPPPRKGLSLLQTITPRPIMQKVRRHPFFFVQKLYFTALNKIEGASTACRQQVSDTFSLP